MSILMSVCIISATSRCSSISENVSTMTAGLTLPVSLYCLYRCAATFLYIPSSKQCSSIMPFNLSNSSGLLTSQESSSLEVSPSFRRFFISVTALSSSLPLFETISAPPPASTPETVIPFRPYSVTTDASASRSIMYFLATAST